ncbi:hypothetical protein IAU60_004553 [Kwoniella sp. DSM 27419]
MPDASPFWLCHECGAQMRPITVNGVPHCASCNGEFIEILDADVNPDPFHDLPPPPPTGPSDTVQHRQQHPPIGSPGEGGHSFLSSFFGNILGAATNYRPEDHRHDGEQADQASPSRTNPNRNQSAGGSRTFQFNFPGGGRGQVVFGSFGGGQGMAGGMGPFGPTGQTTGGTDFQSLFPPGFGPGPFHNQGQRGQDRPTGGPGDPMDGSDLLQALMSIIGEEGGLPPHVFFGGPGGRANFGDYATSEQGFNDILERLMQAAGPQGPLPASDVVIEGLPRFKFEDEKQLAQSVYKDCPVCKDDFAVGDQVVRIPCAHIFHPDCLVPWLKTNGSCPVCRFSLVPEEANRSQPPTNTAAQTRAEANQESQGEGTQAEGGQSIITSVLNRLFGQSGAATSNPTSPSEAEPAHSPFHAPPSQADDQSVYHSDFGAVNLSDQSDQADTLATSAQTSATPSRSTYTTAPSGQSVSGTPANTSGTYQQPAVNAENTAGDDQPTMSTAIPEDYRARHRERERQRQQGQESADPFDLD